MIYIYTFGCWPVQKLDRANFPSDEECCNEREHMVAAARNAAVWKGGWLAGSIYSS